MMLYYILHVNYMIISHKEKMTTPQPGRCQNIIIYFHESVSYGYHVCSSVRLKYEWNTMEENDRVINNYNIISK